MPTNDQQERRQEIEYTPQTIETVDRAIFDWFNKTVDAKAEYPNGELKKVPVIFSSGERYAIQKKGIRDQNGVLVLPMISVRRTGIDPNSIMSALGAPASNLTIAKVISPKSNIIANNIQRMSNSGQPIYDMKPAPVYEVMKIPYPDRNIMSYELIIQTQYITQMNRILEKLFREFDIRKSFVAPIDNNNKHSLNGEEFEDRKPFKGGYFCGFFDSSSNDSGNFDEFTDQERIIRYSTTFTVPANLNLDPEGEKPAITIEQTAYKVSMGLETVGDLDSADSFDAMVEAAQQRRRE